MFMEYMLPGGRVVYTDEEAAFKEEQQAGTCLLTSLESGLSGADAYVEAEADLDELTLDYLTRIFDRHEHRPHEIVRIFAAGGEILVREMTGEDYEAFLRLAAQGEDGLIGSERPVDFEAALSKYHQAGEEERQKLREQFGQQVWSNYRMLDYGLWMIEKGGHAVGLAGLMPGEAGCELEYLLDRDCRGQGVATMVCREIVHYAGAELGIKVLLARTSVDNQSSLRVLQRLGFQEASADGPEHVVLKLEVCNDFE
jgi:RimJ/RimL family protein N-acetyltransferase